MPRTPAPAEPEVTGPHSGSAPSCRGIELSVVLVTPAGAAEVGSTLAALRAQTARERIELVLVGPLADRDLDSAGSGFGAVRAVRREIGTLGGAFADGVRAARADVVVCAEEHSYPEPGWAQALIEAHRGPWVAVGGVLKNANPRTMASWAILFTDFGPAVAPAAPGETQELPGHHTAYKRETLLAYGDRLGRCLEIEWVLQEDLRRAGGRLYREPRAISHHLNVSRLRSNLLAAYFGGRLFAANRSWLREWSPARRLAFVLASPLVLALRVRRAVRDERRVRARLMPRLLPNLILSLVASGAGQAVGCSGSRGGAARGQFLSIELQRHRHMNSRDGDGRSAGATELERQGTGPASSCS